MGNTVDIHLPIMACLTGLVADLCNNSNAHEDRNTSFERLTEKKFRGQLLPVGCQVLHRVTGTFIVVPRWLLGRTWSSHEHLVATETGCQSGVCSEDARGAVVVSGPAMRNSWTSLEAPGHGRARGGDEVQTR